MSRIDHAALLDVLRAAEAVLEARENDMLTAEEWDTLQHAIAAATQPTLENVRDESFRIVEDMLIRSVRPTRGEPYEHTCEQAVFEAVALAIEDLGAASFTYEEVRQTVQAPFTQVAVAVAFMKERGCIVPTVRRRHVAATPGDGVHADAMLEWHALRERAPGAIGGSTSS